MARRCTASTRPSSLPKKSRRDSWSTPKGTSCAILPTLALNRRMNPRSPPTSSRCVSCGRKATDERSSSNVRSLYLTPAPLPEGEGFMNPTTLAAGIATQWDQEIVHQLTAYIRIPAKSPHFDPQWETNGHIERVIHLAEAWAKNQPV